MARKQLKAFLPKDAADLLKVRDIVLGQPGRPIDPPPGGFLPPPDGIPFINDSGEEMPTRGIGAVKAYVLADNGTVYAEIEKPGTTFRRQYVVNTSRQPIADQALGFCQFSSSYRIAHDTSWAPATGESGGPKPGSWLLWKGYPAISSVIGRADETNDILLGTLGEIGEVFGKPQSDIAAATDATTPNTGTVIVQYFDGTEYQATTFELTGTNILPYKIKTGRLYKWVAVGDQWCAVELASRVWEGSIAAPVSAGASGTVTLSDGTAHSGKNVSGSDLEAGSVFAGDDAYGGGLIFTAGGGDGTRKFWKCTLVDEIGPTATGTISLSDTSIGTGGAVEATNRSNSDPGMAGALGFAWKDIDDAYYFIADSLRWFTATLDADLAATDLTAGVTGVVNISGGSVPGSLTDVDNQLELSGSTGDTVFFVESPNAGSEKYYLVAVTSRVNKPRWFKGLLSAALASSSGTASVDGIAALDGGAAPSTATVKNPYSLAGLDNADVLLVEDWDDLDEEDNPTYILVQVKHVAQTVVTDYRYDTSSHKLQKKTRTLAGMWDDAESAWTDVQAFTGYTAITAVDWNSPKVQKKTRTLFVPEAGSESAYVDVLTFEQITVATEVTYTDPTESYKNRTAYVIGPGAVSSNITVWTGTDCD